MSAPRKTEAPDGYFTLDRAWLRDQVRDALKLFFAPLSGVYAALTAPPTGGRD